MLESAMSVTAYRQLLAGTPGKKGESAQKPRRNSPEEDLHRGCFIWVQLQETRYPLLKKMIHVPSGGKRPQGEAGKLKAMGARPGVPDFMLPLCSGRWSGLAVELKSPTGTLSPEQKDWLQTLGDAGYLCHVCRDLETFIEIVHLYLAG